jgi:hypothetical protein
LLKQKQQAFAWFCLSKTKAPLSMQKQSTACMVLLKQNQSVAEHAKAKTTVLFEF